MSDAGGHLWAGLLSGLLVTFAGVRATQGRGGHVGQCGGPETRAGPTGLWTGPWGHWGGGTAHGGARVCCWSLRGHPASMGGGKVTGFVMCGVCGTMCAGTGM